MSSLVSRCVNKAKYAALSDTKDAFWNRRCPFKTKGLVLRAIINHRLYYLNVESAGS